MELTDYQRGDVQVNEWDPSAVEVFTFVHDQISASLPDMGVEHIGSTSVPGLPGKGYVDVMVLPGDQNAITHATRELERLGLAHARGSRPERPFFVGAVRHDSGTTNVHVHVILAESDEARTQHGFAAVAM